MNDNKNCILEPEGFLETIAQHTNQFILGQQQDAQEFLVYLLDQVHEDLNRAKAKTEREEKGKVESDNLSVLGAEEAAKSAWKNYLIDNKSIIVDIFQGQIRSLLRCTECNNSSSTFDPVMYFSLPFPENLAPDKEISVLDLMKEFTKAEKLENKMNCKVCEKKSYYEKKIDLWKAPNILIIHLKRFKFSKEKQGTASKIGNLVNYPLKDLDLSEFVIGFQRLKPQYNLFAICVRLVNYQLHLGTINDGHYMTYSYHSSFRKWLYFDDDDFGVLEEEQDVDLSHPGCFSGRIRAPLCEERPQKL